MSCASCAPAVDAPITSHKAQALCIAIEVRVPFRFVYIVPTPIQSPTNAIPPCVRAYSLRAVCVCVCGSYFPNTHTLELPTYCVQSGTHAPNGINNKVLVGPCARCLARHSMHAHRHSAGAMLQRGKQKRDFSLQYFAVLLLPFRSFACGCRGGWWTMMMISCFRHLAITYSHTISGCVPLLPFVTWARARCARPALGAGWRRHQKCPNFALNGGNGTMYGTANGAHKIICFQLNVAENKNEHINWVIYK